MTIRITCPNGHKLKAKDSHAGRSFPCPACGETVVVPEPQADIGADLESPADVNHTAAADAASPLDDESSPAAQTPALSELPQASDSQSASTPAQTADKRKLYLLVGGVGGGSVLGLLVLLVAWLVFGRDGDDTAPNEDVDVASVAPKGDDTPTDSKPSTDATAAEKAPASKEAAPTKEPPPAKDAPSAKEAPPAMQVPTEDIEHVQRKLRRIALAFHNFHDTYKVFAPRRADSATDSATTSRSSGPPPTSLSWRVHLLPFLEQRALYDQFHLDEPWNSPHNKALAKHMPEVFRIGSSEEPTTRFQVITGTGMLFGNAKPPRFADLRDGSRHTILAIVTGPDRAAPWTKPDELTLDPNAPLASLGTLPDRLVLCAMADGSSLFLRDIIEPADFLALATPAGGEIVDAETCRRRYEEELQVALQNRDRSLAGPAPEPASDPGQSKTTPSTSFPGIADNVHTKLQAVAFAFLIHHDHYGMFTHPATQNEFGSGLSWRVHLLPFLGEEELYRKFHLNEPWDSAHNKALLNEIPLVYRFDDTAQTRIRVFSGPEMLFGTGRPMAHRDISDGASNTLLAVVVGESTAVPWTQPDDLANGPASAAGVTYSVDGGPIECVTADGKLLTLPAGVSRETLSALITPRGGEVVDVAALRNEHGPDYQPDTALTAHVQKTMKTKTDRMNKLKNIVLAMQSYHDTYKQFPITNNAKLFDAQGKPNLSWRVHLLPFLDQQPLYDQFKHEEPWDSPHNITLLDKMPDVFRDPDDDIGGTKTRFVTFTGPNTPYARPQGLRFHGFLDGTSMTLLVVTCGKNKAVPWTKPEDIAFDPDSPVGCLGQLDGPGIYYARVDGAVNIVKASIPPKWFQALVTPAGGEVLPKSLANYGLR